MKISKSSEYDSRWNDWQDMKIFGPTSRHTRRLILALLSKVKFKSVLDIGCGTGLLLSDVKKKFKNVTLFGTEISNNAVAISKKNLPNAKYFVNDISKEPPPLKSDLILCADVLEHIKNYQKAIVSISKVCNKYFLLSTIQGKMRNFEKNVGHVRNFKKKELIETLENNGFEIVKVLEWGFPFYSPIYRSLFSFKKVENMTYGKYTLFQKIIAMTIYYIFYFNSKHRGDYLIILSKRKLK